LVEIFDSEKLRKRAEVFVFPIQNGNARDVAVLLQQIFLGAKPPVVTYPSPPITTPQLSKQSSASLPTPASTITPTTASPSTSTSAVSTVIPTATQGSSDSLLAEGTKIFPDEVANTIIVLATPEDYAIVKDTIQKIDMIPRQVVIEAVIAQVSLTDNLSLGIAWSLRANVFNLDTKIRLNPSSLNADPSIPTGSGLTILGVDSSGSVRALITALATESKAKLLATPHILVSDNREARIQVGQQVPLMTAETYATPGVAPQRIIQYRDIGIILRVKPRVNAGGLVNLEMNQEVSTFSTIVLFDNERQIILNKTEATTNFVVQDGHTIIIGGLIREDNSNSHSGIPFLSKIPIIGWLFGDTNRDKTRTEIIILLTPKVIRDQKGATALTSEYIENMTNKSKGGIKKEELMFRNTNPASGEIKKP
jgi:general secretion pathway protein D